MLAQQEIQEKRSVRESEKEFYFNYDWCLNPILTVEELLQRVQEEFKRYDSLTIRWQAEECTTNLYLFIMAVACTTDDYLSWRPWILFPLKERLPSLSGILGAIEWILNLPYGIASRSRRSVAQSWRDQWETCVGTISDFLINRMQNRQHISRLGSFVGMLCHEQLPTDLLRRRMKIPEGFRCQDLTHYDVFLMVEMFLKNHPVQEPIAVVGLRTAGAYFAPLAQHYFAALGWKSVDSITIRPKVGVTRKEKKRLRSFIKKKKHIFILDDYPNTGHTLRLTLTILQRFGADLKTVTVVVPQHFFKTDWRLSESEAAGVKFLVLESSAIRKQKVLDPEWAEELLTNYYSDLGWDSVRICRHHEIDLLNQRLHNHYGDGFQSRLKNVFELLLMKNNGKSSLQRVFVKSVGWGWLGYHSYIIAHRLHEYVPRVIGLRDGFLFTEWDEPSVKSDSSVSVEKLASYIAARTEKLALKEDPRIHYPDYGWGWLEARAVLRRAYGETIGRLKDARLLKEMRKFSTTKPAVIDGKMHNDEWIMSNSTIYKTDFEHHNFGAPELDIVDSAYDIAGSVFEFHLNESEEEDLIDLYKKNADDINIEDRLLLYKLLYGTVMMRRSLEKIGRSSNYDVQRSLCLRYLAAWNFLIYCMNRFCFSLMPKFREVLWTGRLFFMDVDGVFNSEVFGFPHTTISGIEALNLLHRHGYSVVLNTGRSVEHVRNYCRNFLLPGGVGEYGCFFFDAVRNREIPLVGKESMDELRRCRDAIEKESFAFCDPSYRYAVRLFRFAGKGTVGLKQEEMIKLLSKLNCKGLSVLFRESDTYIVPTATHKGSAMMAVQEYLGIADATCAAMGDSEFDVTMLEGARSAYAPSNCSSQIRQLGKKGRCRIVPFPAQRGLLAAAKHLTGYYLPSRRFARKMPVYGDNLAGLMVKLLSIAERSRMRRLLSTLNWTTL
jgi:hydroxymethylpyrimidine pyrophosphatase-like HAD family hydrolase